MLLQVELARRQSAIDDLNADKEQQALLISKLQSSANRAEADQEQQALTISTLQARLDDHTAQAALNQQVCMCANIAVPCSEGSYCVMQLARRHQSCAVDAW